jgi:hypothetical protein
MIKFKLGQWRVAFYVGLNQGIWIGFMGSMHMRPTFILHLLVFGVCVDPCPTSGIKGQWL